MKEIEIIKKLRTYMEDANGKGAWKPYVGSQLESDIARFVLKQNEGINFELPSDDIFEKSEVELLNPLEEFYYYESSSPLNYTFRERLQKALNYLKGDKIPQNGKV